MSIIFLAGVHGVGKGFLGALVAKSLGMEHLTASRLIKEEKGRETWGADKRVAELDDNQSALIRAVGQLTESGQDILLDGHFVLRGTSGEVVRLAKEVFAALQLAGVVLLTEDAQLITGRLEIRDGTVVSSESISELAAEESAHAREVCSVLRVPLTVLHAPTIQMLTDAVIQLRNSRSLN